MRRILALAAAGVILSTIASAGQMNVIISSPPDGSTVDRRPIVEGTVSDPTASVWVVVHPLEVSDYWVQPRINVRDSGSWKVQIHIGRSGSIDVGKLFEIRAVANPDVVLHEGKVLDGWPKAAAISNMIEIIRK